MGELHETGSLEKKDKVRYSRALFAELLPSELVQEFVHLYTLHYITCIQYSAA